MVYFGSQFHNGREDTVAGTGSQGQEIGRLHFRPHIGGTEGEQEVNEAISPQSLPPVIYFLW